MHYKFLFKFQQKPAVAMHRDRALQDRCTKEQTPLYLYSFLSIVFKQNLIKQRDGAFAKWFISVSSM